MNSLDIFTITNPALGSFILWSFLQGYESNKQGCPYHLLYLPLPLILSENIRNEFKGTNAATGLQTWILRNQKSLLQFSERIEKTQNLTKEAIVFGCSNKIFQIQDDGSMISLGKEINKKNLNKLSDELKEMASAAKKLGKWLSQSNSVSNILISLGLVYETMEYLENNSL